jgi:hypothetical protein
LNEQLVPKLPTLRIIRAKLAAVVDVLSTKKSFRFLVTLARHFECCSKVLPYFEEAASEDCLEIAFCAWRQVTDIWIHRLDAGGPLGSHLNN